MTKRGIIALAGIAAIAVAAILLFVFLRSPSEPEPDPLPTYIIGLDAGHGGRDPGAVVDDFFEKDINLAIVLKLRDLIAAEPNLAAVLTRSLDIFLTLEDRIAKAEEVGAELYVSVHVNSYSDLGPNGVETIVDDTRALDDDSWVLAELIQDNVTRATGARDRGTRTQESYLQRTAMPAVSVETGYITNPEERAKLVTSEYQDLVAQAILEGIRQFIGWKHPPEPVAE